jgi:plastocyanin
MQGNIYYAGFLGGVLLLFVAIGLGSFATTGLAQVQGTTNQTQSVENGNVRVSIGEGSNATVQHYTFTPQTVEINPGESVTWVSPSELSDIHTVTFVLDRSIRSDIILPFAVSGNTSFELVPPFNLGEPIKVQVPDGREALVALNKQAWYPAVVDENNQTTYLNGSDIQYTMDGTEKAINSGIILPQMVASMSEDVNQTNNSSTNDGETMPTGTTTSATNETSLMSNTTDQSMEGGQPQLGPPFPPVSSFTVTFEEPGTYPYFCAIHPWMTGQVIVRGGEENQTQTQ